MDPQLIALAGGVGAGDLRRAGVDRSPAGRRTHAPLPARAGPAGHRVRGPAPSRLAGHRALLEALTDTDCDDEARLAYHAEGVGDADAGPASRAPRCPACRRTGAYREAAAQYERALRFPTEDERAARRALRRVRRASLRSSTAGRRRPRRVSSRSTLWHDSATPDARVTPIASSARSTGGCAGGRVRRRHRARPAAARAARGPIPSSPGRCRPRPSTCGAATPTPATRCSSGRRPWPMRSGEPVRAQRRHQQRGVRRVARAVRTGSRDGRGAPDRAGGAGRGPGRPRLRQRLHVLQRRSSGSPRASGTGATASPTATSATSRRTPPACAGTEPWRCSTSAGGTRPCRSPQRVLATEASPSTCSPHRSRSVWSRATAGAARRRRTARPRRSRPPKTSPRPTGSRSPGWPWPRGTGSPVTTTPPRPRSRACATCSARSRSSTMPQDRSVGTPPAR